MTRPSTEAAGSGPARDGNPVLEPGTTSRARLVTFVTYALTAVLTLGCLSFLHRNARELRSGFVDGLSVANTSRSYRPDPAPALEREELGTFRIGLRSDFRAAVGDRVLVFSQGSDSQHGVFVLPVELEPRAYAPVVLEGIQRYLGRVLVQAGDELTFGTVRDVSPRAYSTMTGKLQGDAVNGELWLIPDGTRGIVGLMFSTKADWDHRRAQLHGMLETARLGRPAFMSFKAQESFEFPLPGRWGRKIHGSSLTLIPPGDTAEVTMTVTPLSRLAGGPRRDAGESTATEQCLAGQLRSLGEPGIVHISDTQPFHHQADGLGRIYDVVAATGTMERGPKEMTFSITVSLQITPQEADPLVIVGKRICPTRDLIRHGYALGLVLSRIRFRHTGDPRQPALGLPLVTPLGSHPYLAAWAQLAVPSTPIATGVDASLGRWGWYGDDGPRLFVHAWRLRPDGRLALPPTGTFGAIPGYAPRSPDAPASPAVN